MFLDTSWYVCMPIGRLHSNLGYLVSTWDLTWHFITSWFCTPWHTGTPQIKLPMKSLLQHTLILHTCTQDLNKKLLRDNGRCNAAKKLAHVLAVSYKLISLVQACQVRSVNDFSHRHKLQQFEVGLKGAACFKIFQVTLNSILASFKCQMCLPSSSVLSALLPVLLLYSFCLFYFEFEGNFWVQIPGGLYLEGRFIGKYFASLGHS